MRARPVHLLLVSGYIAGIALSLAAWVFSNPPMAAPDEPANFVKAGASAALQWRGRPVDGASQQLPPRVRAWYAQATRTFDLDRVFLSPPTATCMAFRPYRSASCQKPGPVLSSTVLVQTPQGVYPPFFYLPAGLAASQASTFRGAVFAARAAGASCVLVLVLLTLTVLLRGEPGLRPWRRSAERSTTTGRGRTELVRLAGLAGATTPAVLFLGGSVSTNGLEIATGLALWACALRFGLPRTRAQCWTSAIVVALLSVSRIIDPAFVVVIVAIAWLAGAAPQEPDPPKVDASGLTRLLAASVAVGGFLLSVGWNVFLMPHPPTDLALAGRLVPDLVTGLPDQGRQAIGIFGWLDTPLPGPLYLGWAVLVVVVTGLGLAAGNARERWALGALILLVPVVDVAVGSLVLGQIGFPMQARYVLVLAGGIPLLAGEVVARRMSRDPSWSLSAGAELACLAAVVVAPVLHAGALAVNLHRNAAGIRSSLIPPWTVSWDPPGGFGVWTVTYALIAVSGLAAIGPVGRRFPGAAGRRAGGGRLPN